MADGVMVEIVRNYVNKTEKRYHGRFLTGFSIEMAKNVRCTTGRNQADGERF
jgi:hypothetical protein